MNQLNIFKDSFMQNLRISTDENLKNYLLDDVWVDKIGYSTSRDLPTLIDKSKLPKLISPVNKDLRDVENVIKIHSAFSELTSVQARDPRLWTRLCHVEYWSYMRVRWPIERYLKDKDGEKKAKGRILERYFILHSQGRSLIRNGIARLWWYGSLSYKLNRDDPYELTKVLMSTLDITQTILERSLGRAPNVLHGFLEFLSRHKDDLLTGGTQNRNLIRKLAKLLNMHGGVRILDYLSESQIIDLLEEEYGILRKQDEKYT